MEPITDQDVRQRLTEKRQQVALQQDNVDRWQVEVDYWTGKLGALRAADGAAADPPVLVDYIAKVEGFRVNVIEHRDNAAADVAELVAVMAAAGVEEEAAG